MWNRRDIFGDAGRYCLSGLGAAATDFGSYLLLHYVGGLTPAAANLISRPLGGVVSFLLHKYFSFQNRGTAPAMQQAGRFGAVWLLTFILSQGGVWLLTVPLAVQAVLAKLVAEGAAAGIGFICQRHWTFAARPTPER